MEVALRPFRESDLARLDGWAAAIGSGRYMSRYRPLDRAVAAHDPQRGVLWFVVAAGGREVGTVWLEADAQPGQAILGIMLGEPGLLGRGIGTTAIELALEEARLEGRFTTVILHVRVGNRRAIACYEKCGFRTVSTGVKHAPSGVVIRYLVMGRAIGPEDG